MRTGKARLPVTLKTPLSPASSGRSELTIPLLPYQHEGADFLASRERAGLFDEPGVGKTATAIGALDRIGARRVMVVAPAAVREVWVGEHKKFATTQRKVLKGRTIHDLALWLRGKADMLVTSYEMAARWAPKIEEAGDIFDALVIDESHYAKSPTAQRTRALFGTQCDGRKGIGALAARTWMLTGTPASNDPTDIWPFLRYCNGTGLTLPAFTTRYFRSYQGVFSARQTPRDEMMPELRALIAQHSIRRTKTDVGLQLPPIWLTTTTVDGDTKEIRDLLMDHPDLEQAILDALEAGGLSFLDAQHVATLRRLVGEAKAPAFAELLIEELNGGMDKVVVMGVHRRALAAVQAALVKAGIHAVLVDGNTSEPQRVAAVEAFQNDPACRVFIGNIRAAGTGLTLTAAAEIVLMEQSWSPADNAQALMRVHRLGQTRSVRARLVVLADSIDEVVVDRVREKTAAIAQIGFDMQAVEAA